MTDRRISTWWLAGRLAWYRPGVLLLSLVFFAAASASMLLIGWLLKQVFNAIGGGGPAGLGIYGLIAVLASVEVARIAASFGGVVRTLYWERLRGLLRLNMLRAQMASGGPRAGTSPASPVEALSSFRDDVDDFLAFCDIAVFVAGELLFAVGSIAIMLSIDPLITIAVVLPISTMAVTTRIVSGRIRDRRAAYRRASVAVTGLLGEMFGAVLALKTAPSGTGILSRLADLNERRRRAALRDQLVMEMLDTFNRLTVDLSIGLVLLLAIPAMRSGGFTVGDFALFASYTSALVAMPRYTGRLIANHRRAGVAADRMTALLPAAAPASLVTHRPLFDDDTPPSAPRPLARPLWSLNVRGMTAVHPGSGRGVRDVGLTLAGGTFTVITGPAGAGKTTLLRAILGLVPVRGGELFWNGELVSDRAAFLVPPRCAYVPQVPRLFSEPLRDNLLLGFDDAAGLETAVRCAVLDDDVAAMPDGLGTAVGTRGVRLSGGQVQRAAIARALVRRPDLLVLDDVSSGLDVHTERQLWDRLLAWRDCTLLVVSNRPATIARADQVIRLDLGRIRPNPELRTAMPTPDTPAA